jgi:chromate transporter
MNIPQTWTELFTKEGLANLFKWPSLIAYSIFAFLLIKFKLHPIIIILLGAGFGILFL